MKVVPVVSISLSVVMSSLCVAPIYGLDAASIKAAKRATALVEIPGGRGSASAFCVNKKGYFITNQHVSRAARQNEKIKLVLWPTEKDQTVVDADIMREDETLDLALLRISTNLTLTALGMGDAEELVETTEVAAFGYPFGKSLATEDNSYPAISINVGRITSLRRKEGELHRIQIDAEVNPGNSGGPLVGPDGKVVGVIVAGIFGSAVNFAIPSGHLEKFLLRPKLALTPPTLTVSNLSSEVVFKVHADTIFESATPMTITLTLTPGAMDPRTYAMTRMPDGSYEIKTQILPPSDKDGVLNVTAEFEDSTLKCRLPDMPVKIDDRQTALRDVRMVRTQKTTEVTMRDGSKHVGPITGLGVVRTKVGRKPVDIDFSKATGIAVVDLGAISLVRYSIRATQNGKSLETLEGVIGVKGAGGLGDQFMKGLILHYTFDNLDKLAADNSPAERHGTVHGAKHSNDGRRNGAADFDGRTSHIRTPVVDTTKDLTWAMWVRPRSLVDTSGVVQLLGLKGHGWVWNSGNTSIHITRADERLLSLRFYVQVSETHAASVGTDVTPGDILDHWVHVASTVSTDGWRIYKDGKLAAHSRETGKFGSPCAMIIGANDNGPQRYFDGLIDEVMVFDRALSSDEVLLLYESQK